MDDMRLLIHGLFKIVKYHIGQYFSIKIYIYMTVFLIGNESSYIKFLHNLIVYNFSSLIAKVRPKLDI